MVAGCPVYFSGPTTLIYSSGRNTRNINQFNQFYDKIKNNKFENSIETKKRICQLLAEYATHKCNYCDERSPERRDFEDPIMDMSVIWQKKRRQENKESNHGRRQRKWQTEEKEKEQ